MDSIRVIDRRLELIEALAMHWLEDCEGPDSCDGSDVDEDGVGNFRDFADWSRQKIDQYRAGSL